MKVNVIGETLVITLNTKMEDLRLVKSYAPEILRICDDKGDELFVVDVGAAPDFGRFGAIFDGADAAGNARLSVTIPGLGGLTTKEEIARLFAGAFNWLKQLEPAINEAAETARTDIGRIAANIEIM